MSENALLVTASTPSFSQQQVPCCELPTKLARLHANVAPSTCLPVCLQLQWASAKVSSWATAAAGGNSSQWFADELQALGLETATQEYSLCTQDPASLIHCTAHTPRGDDCSTRTVFHLDQPHQRRNVYAVLRANAAGDSKEAVLVAARYPRVTECATKLAGRHHDKPGAAFTVLSAPPWQLQQPAQPSNCLRTHAANMPQLLALVRHLSQTRWRAKDVVVLLSGGDSVCSDEVLGASGSPSKCSPFECSGVLARDVKAFIDAYHVPLAAAAAAAPPRLLSTRINFGSHTHLCHDTHIRVQILAPNWRLKLAPFVEQWCLTFAMVLPLMQWHSKPR